MFVWKISCPNYFAALRRFFMVFFVLFLDLFFDTPPFVKFIIGFSVISVVGFSVFFLVFVIGFSPVIVNLVFNS